MQYKIEKKPVPNQAKYDERFEKAAHAFAQDVRRHAGSLVKAVVLFHNKRRTTDSEKQLDVVIVIDDCTHVMTSELVESLRIIVEKAGEHVHKHMFISSIKLTHFWEYVLAGDPLAMHILREGTIIYDENMILPLQYLLKTGRIKPSIESVWKYFNRAPPTLQNSQWHLLQACVDLYWAVIDMTHAALMFHGFTSPSPEHAARAASELVRKKVISHKDAAMIKEFYVLAKDIMHQKKRTISGKEFERWHADAEHLIKKMRKSVR